MPSHEVLYREEISIWAIALITNISGSILSRHLPNSFITNDFAVILTNAALAILKDPVKTESEKRMSVGVLNCVAS